MKKYDEELSRQLDKAIRALESDDETRQKLGKIWKRKLEELIFEDGKDCLLQM